MVPGSGVTGQWRYGAVALRGSGVTGQWRYGAVALRVVSQRASFGIIQMFNSRSGGIRQAASGANSAAETALLHSGGLLRLADCRHGAHSGRAHAGRAPPPVRGARDAVRVGDERDKQPDRADQQRPVAVQPEPAVERVRYQALGGAQAGEQRAADHRDPAEVRIGDDHQRVTEPNRSELTVSKLYAYSAPHIPAISALTMNAVSLTRRTSMPAAEAARSLDRTASIRWPIAPRRRAATSRQSRISTTSTTMPKTGLGTLPSMPRNGACGDRLRPKTRSGLTGDPEACAPQAELPKPNCSTATAPASVTTARLTPRTRSEATAVMKPTISAQPIPASGASGKSAQIPPTLVSMCDIAYPVTPARATWTTEICPTKPTTTTSDRQIIAPSIELTIACLKS